jgi:hypothetical protein
MGVNTTNGYFYLPEYGASGTAEKALYDAGQQVADTQIEANKDAIDGKIGSLADDTTPELGGDLDLVTYSIGFAAALATDHSYKGIVDVVAVGESVVFGQLLYFDWTEKEFKLAKADAVGTTPALAIALEDKSSGENCKLLRMGYIRDDSWEFAGSIVYLSDATAGAATTTVPSTSEHFVQRVGQAKSADIMYFNPSIDIGEVS